MNRDPLQFLVALLSYPPLFLASYYVKTGLDHWPSVPRYVVSITVTGLIVLGLLWLPKLNYRVRGLVYALGMLAGSVLYTIWIYKKYIANPEYGWSFFFSGLLQVLPLHLVTSGLVLGLLALVRWRLRPVAEA